MKPLASRSLVAAAVALATVASVQAVSISLITLNSTGPANPDLTFTGFPDGPTAPGGIAISNGGTLSYNGATIVQSINNSEGAPPFPTTPGNEYLSVKTGGVATFSYTTPQSTFGFQWGSIDTYNTIEFYLGNVMTSFTGTDIVIPANGNQNIGGSAYVEFTGPFDKVVLKSTQNSFEIDNVTVPDGGNTLVVFGGVLGLLGVVSRKLRK